MRFTASFLPLILIAGCVSTVEILPEKVGEPELSNRCDVGVLECIVSIETPSSPMIAPDGSAIIYEIRKADWDHNRFDRELYLNRGGETTQLTHNDDGSAADASWSPDGALIAFRATTDNGAQLFLMNPDGTGQVQITDIRGGVGSYVWSPQGDAIAMSRRDEPKGDMDAREKHYGDFSFADDYSARNHLWLLNVDAAREALVTDEAGLDSLRRLTKGDAFTLGSFFGGSFTFTPDGREILFDHSDSLSPYDLGTQDISAVNIETGELRPIVRRPGIDQGPHISPDGQTVAFHMGEPPYYYTRQYWLATVPIEGGEINEIHDAAPSDASIYGWYGDGLYFLSHVGVESLIYRQDMTTGEVNILTEGRGRITRGGSITDSGDQIAFLAVDGENAIELYTRDLEGKEQRLTNFSAAISDWPDTQVELVRWTTPDGLELEGILTLPAMEHRMDGPMPVLAIVHGGPSSTSRPKRIMNEVYPAEYWLRKGAAIFEPNYRGSGSYTDELMAANVRSMGEGYAVDLESGFDYLIEKGIADPERMGVMGWSAGGSVTAAMAVRTDRYKAFSIGAGIGDYGLYYALSDQPTSPLAYLEATPWDDPDIYDRTGAIAHIRNAVTPTLIQHGRDDGRVPFGNGMQLYRGLKDAGVETELVIFENTGHVISRPREWLAALEQNARWFDTYLFEDRAQPDLHLMPAIEE